MYAKADGRKIVAITAAAVALLSFVATGALSEAKTVLEVRAAGVGGEADLVVRRIGVEEAAIALELQLERGLILRG